MKKPAPTPTKDKGVISHAEMTAARAEALSRFALSEGTLGRGHFGFQADSTWHLAFRAQGFIERG